MALLGYTADLLDDQTNYVLYEIADFADRSFVVQSLTQAIDPTLDDIVDRDANPDFMVLLGEGTGSGPGVNESIPEQFIRGRVVDIEGDGCARVVIAVDRATGTRLAITTSDPAGNFTLRPRTLDACILLAVPLNGEQLNAVVLDNVLPVAS